MPRRLLLVLAVVALGFSAPASARAGTYHVHACATAGAQWPNASWTGPAVPGVVVDANCNAPGSLIGLRIDGGKQIANGASATLAFTAAPGTTIADFKLDRHLDFQSNPPMSGTRPLYALYQLGALPFAGAGDYNGAVRDRLHAVGAWYGYPSGNATLSRRTTRMNQLPALAGYDGKATSLFIRVGCYRRANGTKCSAPAGKRVFHVLHGIDVTVRDLVPPRPTVAAEGLLAGGPRHGSDPVVVSATDNAGIRRVMLLDVTGASPEVVGSRAAACNARFARPCPNLSRALVVPTGLQVGRRSIVVRTIDAGGNAVDRGPYVVDVVTPSDRGAPNGDGATDTATLTARFPKRDRRERTVRYGKRVRVTGQLLNAVGQPISGARLDVRTRDRVSGAKPVTRTTATTAADGTYGVTVRARASRDITVGWRARLNDAFPAAAATVTLRTRARASLRPSTRRPALGARLRLRGRLRAPARRVTVILQGRAAGARRFTTFADTVTRRGGRFSVGYRFRDPASRGRRFAFRAKIKRSRGYPFEAGYSRRVHVRVR